MEDTEYSGELAKIRRFFSESGTLAKHLDGYEPRPAQAEMAAEVYKTIKQGGALILEAGTGTGKTLAYLVPLLAAGKRIVISTGTKNLQEQLFFTDIPFLKKLGGNFQAAIMKGRGNYLCLRKAGMFRSQPLLKGMEEVNQFRAVENWASTTKTGDFQEIPEIAEGSPLLRRLACGAENCTGRKCADFMECWLVKAREKAAKADVLVVNHHLLFADMSVREGGFGAVLPDYDYVIFDEAHEIENVATSYFGVEVSNWQVEELQRDTLTEMAAEKVDDPRLEKYASLVVASAQKFFAGLSKLKERQRLNPGSFTGVEEEFQQLHDDLESYEAYIKEVDDQPESFNLLARRAADLRYGLQMVVNASDPAYVFWYETRGRGVYLKANPVDVSGIVRDHVLEQNEATVMVSATLTVQGSFQYMKERLGAVDASEKQLGSPYDYKKLSRLYVPRKFPLPSSQEFPGAVAEEVANLLKITSGRTFVLFTSLRNMTLVHQLLTGKTDFPLFVQGTASKRSLLEGYLNTENPVLLASYSFWQGVDVRGEQLSQVIIDKIPFAVPDDPLTAARIDRVRDAGGNPFFDLQVPHAALMLKQGLGRLIRSSADRGIMAVLDTRLLTRRYGKTLLGSLYGSPLTSDMASVRRWWNREEAGQAG